MNAGKNLFNLALLKIYFLFIILILKWPDNSYNLSFIYGFVNLTGDKIK
mgnify:FL=1